MLKKADLEKIKKELLLKKQELEIDLRSLSQDNAGDKSQSQDDGDQVVALTMESLRNSLKDTELHEYDQVLSALKSLDAGTYGICKECKGDISEKRLKYYPNVQNCLSCQEKLEEQG